MLTTQMASFVAVNLQHTTALSRVSGCFWPNARSTSSLLLLLPLASRERDTAVGEGTELRSSAKQTNNRNRKEKKKTVGLSRISSFPLQEGAIRCPGGRFLEGEKRFRWSC